MKKIRMFIRSILDEILLVSKAKKILKKSPCFIDLKILIENAQQAGFGNTPQMQDLKNWLADFKEYDLICKVYQKVERVNDELRVLNRKSILCKKVDEMKSQLEALKQKIIKNSIRKTVLEVRLGIY